MYFVNGSSELISEEAPVVASKSYFGNLGAASGMIELITSLLAIEHGQLFPILNYETPDPDCPIRAFTETPSGDSFINVRVTPIGQASAVAVKRVAT